MVAMAFASPLVKKFIDSKTGEERVDMMDLLMIFNIIINAVL